jgi:hypothetical protein
LLAAVDHDGNVEGDVGGLSKQLRACQRQQMGGVAGHGAYPQMLSATEAHVGDGTRGVVQ